MKERRIWGISIIILISFGGGVVEPDSAILPKASLKLKMISDTVRYIEPILVHTELTIEAKTYRSVGTVGKRWAPIIQVRRMGTKEWKNLLVLEPGGTQMELNDPYTPIITFKQHDVYKGNWATIPWKFNANRSELSEKESWHYPDSGKYEIRAVHPSGRGKKGWRGKPVYSNVETFEVIERRDENQEVVEYLLNLPEPRFLFDCHSYESYYEEAQLVFEKFDQTHFSAWAFLYLVQEEFSSHNKEVSAQRQQQLEEFIKEESNPFLREMAERMLESIHHFSQYRR